MCTHSMMTHPPAPSSVHSRPVRYSSARSGCNRGKDPRSPLSRGMCLYVTPEEEAFDYLVACPKLIVVSLMCILSCLHHLEPIQLVPLPLHNTATLLAFLAQKGQATVIHSAHVWHLLQQLTTGCDALGGQRSGQREVQSGGGAVGPHHDKRMSGRHVRGGKKEGLR